MTGTDFSIIVPPSDVAAAAMLELILFLFYCRSKLTADRDTLVSPN